MEISEITIKNFKGIEEIRMGPIKPINVLIGRNNSGKSSALECLQLLYQYFATVASANIKQPNATIPVPNEFFKREKGDIVDFEVSIKVVQTEEERDKQFNQMAQSFCPKYKIPIAMERISTSVADGLFDNLIFCFRATTNGKKFALISVRTAEKIAGSVEAIIAQSPNPGVQLDSLALEQLFISQFNSVTALSRQTDITKRKVNVREGKLVLENPDTFNMMLLNPAFEHIKKTLRTVFMVSPYRHGEKIVHAQRRHLTLDENGTNIVNYLYNFFLNDHKTFQKVADFVEKIAPDVGRLHPQNPPANSGVQHPLQVTDSQLELAYEWPDGRVVNLANMGGGIEQLIILGSILLQQKDSCVLVEEPESHLHPAAQEILLNKLEEYVGNSTIFMTTHSPVFVRSNDKIAVHIITNKDGKSGKGRTLLSDELQEAATVLGSRPGHLAQADIVVYVEGKRGAEAFEEWLKKWPDRDKVLGHLLLAIWFLSPDDIGAKDFDLAPLKKVTQNMIIFVDKDNDEGSSEPKTTRRELQEKCKALDIPCIITEKRQIEDYFTEEAVRKILPANLQAGWNYDASKPMSQQLPTKKYNAKIAAAMKWEDIAKYTDIMKVFEEIGKYAKILSPETNDE